MKCFIYLLLLCITQALFLPRQQIYLHNARKCLTHKTENLSLMSFSTVCNTLSLNFQFQPVLRPHTGSSHAFVFLFDYEHEKKQKGKGRHLKHSAKLTVN